MPIPEPPVLHPISYELKLNWLGAPTGRYYRIERKNSAQKAWQIIAENVSDGRNLFGPTKHDLFEDHSVLKDSRYHFRVIAINESGEFQLSNIQTVVLSKFK